MEKVMLDSSVWISLFVQDIFTRKAEKIYAYVRDNGDLILVPNVVYAEVINNINKADKTGFLLAQVKNIFHEDKKVRLISGDDGFWYSRFEEYTKKVRLKTIDLLIIAFLFEFEATKFYSFDKRLNKCYKFLKKNL